MSNELVCVELQDLENTQKIVATLLKTPHYQKMGNEGVYAIVAKAKSLGISPLDALNGGLYYVSGKVGMAAETMASLIRQAGHSIVKDNKSNNGICILHGRRKDNGDTWTIEFSMEDARRAGLAKNMYEKYPGVMLYNRAMSMLARQLFPDIIKGAGYTLDELKEIAANNGDARSFNRSSPELPEAEYAEIKVERLNSEQVNELRDVMKECDEEYKIATWKEWRRLWNIKTLDDIPSAEYDGIISGAMRRISDNIKNRPTETETSMSSEEMKKIMEGE